MDTSINPEAFAFGPTNIKSVFHFTQLSAREVANVLKSLPNKLSTGSDGISYQLLKEAGPGIVGPLTTLFNRSISLGQVPDEWKHAIVSPIYKGGRKDRRNPTNYRPISLTSCVARTMEKLLHCQVLEYLQTNGLLYEHQAGFLPNHSTVTQLCFLTHKWQMTLDKGHHVQTAFLDLSKAYDRVSVPGLLFKLSDLGFSGETLRWFSSFLTNRQQCVRVNGSSSDTQCLISGIPQGTVLGPLLFLIFINDLPKAMTNNCPIFADDTSAYTTGKNITTTTVALSLDVTAASSWADIWGMLFNAEKSEHMMICGRRLKGVAPQPSVSMAGIPIPQVKIHKHLGVIFNDTLTWSNHIDKVYERCAQRVGILRRLRRTFPSRALRRIYVGAVLPIMEYACPVWSGGPVAKLIHLHESFCRRNQTSLPPLQKRFDFHTLVLFYKMRKNLTPSYLSSLMPSPLSTSGYQFRREPYPIPAVSKISSLASFVPRAIILWNTLPSSIQSARTVSQFKCLLKSHMHI